MSRGMRRQAVRWAARHLLKIRHLNRDVLRDAARRLLYETIKPASGDPMPSLLRDWIKDKHPDVTRLAGEAADLCADIEAMGLADAADEAREWRTRFDGRSPAEVAR